MHTNLNYLIKKNTEEHEAILVGQIRAAELTLQTVNKRLDCPHNKIIILDVDIKTCRAHCQICGAFSEILSNRVKDGLYY